MWCLLVIFSLLLAAGLHAGLARLKPAGNRVGQFLLTGAAAGAALLAGLSLLGGTSRPGCLAAVAAYAFACELYIFLFTFVTSSVSVALLLGKPEAGAAAAGTGEMVGQRLATMVASGLLDRQGDSFQLNPRSRRTVAIYQALRRFFRHDIGQE